MTMSAELLLFDLRDRVQIEMTGRDRATFLHNFCTNDIKKLRPGHGCEAFVTNIKGKVLGHIFVFAEETSLWIESVAGSAETLMSHLGRFVIREDVQLHDRSTEFAELLLTGSSATELLSQWFADAAALPLYGHLSNGPPSLPARSVRRVDWLESPTWLMSVPRAGLDAVCQKLTQSGCVSADAEQFHARRIAAGFPLFGVDITEDNLAQEVDRTSLAISFTKGCYLGQEPIARLDAMGHVNRQLCRLKLASPDVPPAGAEVFEKLAPAGQPIGAITSAARCVGFADSDEVLALAYLRSAFASPNKIVFVNQRTAKVF